MQQVSPVRLAFEKIHGLLDLGHTMVKPAFFAVLDLQGPSLQCFPLNRIRNEFGTGGMTSLHQLFKIPPYLRQ